MEIKKYIIIILNIIVVVALFEIFGGGGIVGYLIIAGFFALYRLFKMRKQFMVFLRYIETNFFGKPLDKELWEKGEFKNRKKEKYL